MNVLIVSATKLEIQPTLSLFNKLSYNVVITGIGAAPSVYTITKAIQKHQPEIIIQAGIAGCFNKTYDLGTVFTVSQDCFGDVGVMENKAWKSVFDLNLFPLNKKPFKNGRLINPYKKLLKSVELNAVSAVTVNEISTNKSRIQMLKECGFVIESMEGAALHYVALMEKVPFLQIRSVSNFVGERDKQKWNLKDAVINLNTELKRVVEKIEANDIYI